MNEIIINPKQMIVPVPRVPINIRPAVMGDLAFIDALHKKHTHAVGWMPTKQLEGKIAAGRVIVAEERRVDSGKWRVDSKVDPAPLSTIDSSLSTSSIGYAIGHDQYFKRDDVGIIYQVNVVPGKRRALVGAMLVKAMFERAAWGCKLFCCWCAQDLEANYFWESLGFVPLAFRAGGESRGQKSEARGQATRVHIFWQKRIRAGDVTTPWWYPSKTDAGAIREDRIVLPIPPGAGWKEVGGSAECEVRSAELETKNQGAHCLAGPLAGRSSRKSAKAKSSNSALSTPRSALPPSRVQFGPPGMKAVVESPKAEETTTTLAPAKRKKVKVDPKMVAAARELRDRWLEKVNDNPGLLAGEGGKYEVSRLLGENHSPRMIAA